MRQNQQYLRSAAITYVALEFSWPREATEEERIESWGIRIEFRNTAENQGHIKPFVVYGTLCGRYDLESHFRGKSVSK